MSRNTRLSLTHSLNDTHTFKKKYVDLTITKLHVFLKKCGQSSASFILFSSFSQHCDKYSTKFDYQSIDGVLGIRTRDRRMVVADESTVQWWNSTKLVQLLFNLAFSGLANPSFC